MDAMTQGALDKLHALYPRASICLSHQFLDGVDGKACGLVPEGWDGSAVKVTGKWWEDGFSVQLTGAAHG